MTRKEYMKEYQAKWYQKNKARLIASGLEWARKNPERSKEIKKKWADNNKEALKKKNSEWAKANPEKMRAAAERYRKAHPDLTKSRKNKWNQANPEKGRARSANWRNENPELVASLQAKYRKENVGKIRAYQAVRRSFSKRATPTWANNFFMDEIYNLAKLRTSLNTCGVNSWTVDHIVPMRSKLVCGLHVENNLRVIPRIDNLKKGNRHWPDMP